jgi:Tol biopolymer transport system component
VTRTETSRLWSLPFDAAARRVTGEGQPVTSPTMFIEAFDLSADGRWLAYVVRRTGKRNQELWVRSYEKGAEALLAEATQIFAPRLARDGSRIAFRLTREWNPRVQSLSWMARTGGEEHALPQGIINPWDWSADGARIIHNCPPPAAVPTLCSSSRDATTTAETKTIVADSGHDFWQGRFSPDGRWVVFNAQPAVAGVSVTGVVPASGGKWTPITAATLWADNRRVNAKGESESYSWSGRLDGSLHPIEDAEGQVVSQQGITRNKDGALIRYRASATEPSFEARDPVGRRKHPHRRHHDENEGRRDV